jgi:tape measure domain-containing protein
MAIVDQLIAVLEYQTKGEADLKRFTKSLDTLATKAAAVGAAMGKVAAVAGAAVAGGLAFLGKSVIDTGRTFENLQIQLEALEGSQDKAKKAMDWIKTFAADTPLELEEVVKAYAQLRTYGLDPVNGSLLALVDTMAMSGKGQEHLDGIITAVGQAWTKQKLQGEEAMQLLERGVPVWDLLSTAMGKTVPELQELATKGKLGRKEIQLLINAMGKRAVGASAKMAKSLDGVTSALSDMWTEFKSRIADSGFYRSVKDQLERTLAVVKQWASDGTMDRAAGVIGGAFTRAANAVGSAIDRIVTHTGFLNKNWDKARPYIIAITAALAALLAAWAPITAVVLAAAFAIDDFLTYLEDGDSVIGAFIDWIKNIASAFTENPAEAGAAWARLLIEGIKNAFQRSWCDTQFGLWGLIWSGQLGGNRHQHCHRDLQRHSEPPQHGDRVLERGCKLYPLRELGGRWRPGDEPAVGGHEGRRRLYQGMVHGRLQRHDGAGPDDFSPHRDDA